MQIQGRFQNSFLDLDGLLDIRNYLECDICHKNSLASRISFRIFVTTYKPSVDVAKDVRLFYMGRNPSGSMCGSRINLGPSDWWIWSVLVYVGPVGSILVFVLILSVQSLFNQVQLSLVLFGVDYFELVFFPLNLIWSLISFVSRVAWSSLA